MTSAAVPLGDLDLAFEYRATRRRVSEQMSGLSHEQLETVVPSCPDWTVRDVLRHQAGEASDIVSGNMKGAVGPEWTGAHVRARVDRSVDELIEEWEREGSKVEPVMNQAPDMFAFLLADVVTHELDVQGALGVPQVKDNGIIRTLAGVAVFQMGRRVKKAGLPALWVRAGTNEWLAGDGEPGASVEAPDAFEVFRAITGRRSRDQVREWDWDGEPDDYLPVMPFFEPRTTPLVE